MASVAICPHCYLQLAVPVGTDSDARVECPTCHREFDLPQAVRRPIPEVVPVERTTAAAATVPEIEAMEVRDDAPSESPLDSLNKMFRARETVDDAAPELAAEREAKTQAEKQAVEEDLTPQVAPRAATLAELMAERAAQEQAVVPGPSFDLPNVPLARDNGGTVEFESIADFGAAANTEFELDDVDFDAVPPHALTTDMSEPYSNEPDFARSAAADPVPYGAEELLDPSIVVGPPARRRRRSPLRMLVGTVLGGVLGLSVGYYILMFLRGPEGDLLDLARYLPPQVLPSSFAHASAPLDTPSRMPMQLQQPTRLQPAEESANIPAGYVESTGEPLANDQESVATDADHYEPSQFDDAPADPLTVEPLAAEPPTTEPASIEPSAEMAVPFPLSGPTYSAEQFAAALEAAEQAQSGLVDGDLSDAAVRRIKGLSYAKLCDLAHALVFVARTANSPSDAEQQTRAVRLFEETLAAPHTRDEVARIAAIWIDSPHRRHGGVFLAGTVGGGQIAGDVYEYQLELEDGSTYAVLSSQPIEDADGADTPLAIIGTIVDRPSDEVAGYTGTAERAIWASRALPLQ